MREYLFKTDKEIMTCQECPIVKKNGLGTICPLREGAERKYGTCPLVEVPPHGRLSDTDELLKKVREEADFPSYEWCKAIECIEDAPTVIEASTSIGFCNTEGCNNTKPDMSKAQNHICPYYQGVCFLDEHIVCYCQHHYEMCEKFIKIGKETK